MGEMVRHKILFPGRDCILVITRQSHLMLTSPITERDLILSEAKRPFETHPRSISPAFY